MPYHRPAYQLQPYQHQQQQQQQQQQHHYQQRPPHASNVFPPPPPPPSGPGQQGFIGNRIIQIDQTAYHPQTVATGSHQKASPHSAPMMMVNNHFDGSLEREIPQDGCTDASQNFPSGVYYCEDQSFQSQAVYHAQSPDMAFARNQAYEATNRQQPFNTTNYANDSGEMPPQCTGRIAGPYSHELHDERQPPYRVTHIGDQQHLHPQLYANGRAQTRLPHETHDEFSQPRLRALGPELHPQPSFDIRAIYANQLSASEYSTSYQAPTSTTCMPYTPEPASQPLVRRQSHEYQTRYSPGNCREPMDSRDNEHYPAIENPIEIAEIQQINETHYATVHHQPEQLVRQEMGVNPRKISRVSASPVTSPAARQQLSYHQSARHSVDDLSCDQYSTEADTYRVVASSFDEANSGPQLARAPCLPQTPFVDSVQGEQTEGYQLFTEFRSSVSSSDRSTREQPQSAADSQTQEQAQRQQQQQGNYIDMRPSGTVSQDWLDMICRHMIEHMNNFGICVIDNFLGSLKGEAILNEVLQLYSHRNYTTGRLVSDVRDETSNDLKDDNGRGAERASKPATVDPAKLIRNDRVIWVDGCEEGCSEINNLIHTLCSVITNSSRLSLYTGNALDKIVIDKRTKAHVACYPGNRTRYIKHVDNPNNDGRIITAIYYLNKDWNSKRDGGLLRMFPAGMDTVANIEPLFDRVLFFWSDRRNPHEVLPAFRDRFAITVWYIASRAQ